MGSARTVIRGGAAVLALVAAWGCGSDSGKNDSRTGDQLVPDAYQYKLDLGGPPGPDGPGREGGPDLPPKPDGGGAGVIYKNSFDTTNGGLTGTLDWQWGATISFSAGAGCDAAATPPTAGHSGTGMWGTKLNDCHSGLGNNANAASGTCSNANPADDSVLTLKVQIPSTYTTVTLSYWEWTDVNYYFDWHEVRVNNVVKKATCPSGYTKPTAWVNQTLDLSAYKGQQATITFHFMDSTVVNYAGWYLDDIEVSGK